MSKSDSHYKTEQIILRPAQTDDEAFLYQLYESTRKEEVSAFGWDVAQQETFLKFQFTAQRSHYEMAYPAATHTIILVNDQPAGRILVFRAEQEIHLVDIALLPEYRGHGIGAELIGGLIEEAAAKGVPLKLHVEKHNRAARLYDRLGFTVIADTGVYYEMARLPIGRQQSGPL